MKKVRLLGDSIRLGYETTVRKELAGQAEIWAPEGNCMHSIHHLFNLTWYLEEPVDVIHFNFGLWDCRRLGRDRPENAIPVELFVRNLDFLLEKLRQGTSAKLIWATITPIVQARYNSRFTRIHEPARHAADIDLYNGAAAPVLARHGMVINDLNALVHTEGVETMICDDGVHYTDEGSATLGRRVAEEIRRMF